MKAQKIQLECFVSHRPGVYVQGLDCSTGKRVIEGRLERVILILSKLHVEVVNYDQVMLWLVNHVSFKVNPEMIPVAPIVNSSTLSRSI